MPAHRGAQVARSAFPEYLLCNPEQLSDLILHHPYLAQVCAQIRTQERVSALYRYGHRRLIECTERDPRIKHLVHRGNRLGTLPLRQALQVLSYCYKLLFGLPDLTAHLADARVEWSFSLVHTEAAFWEPDTRKSLADLGNGS